MKNKCGWTFCVLLVLCLGIIGCDEDTLPEEKPDQKTIVIEGITETGRGRIRVFSDLNNVVNHVPVNAGVGQANITNGTLTCPLTVPDTNNESQTYTPWTGSGSYYIYFIPELSSWSTANGLIYVGDGEQPQKYNINKTVTTFSYNKFKEYNVWK